MSYCYLQPTPNWRSFLIIIIVVLLILRLKIRVGLCEKIFYLKKNVSWKLLGADRVLRVLKKFTIVFSSLSKFLMNLDSILYRNSCVFLYYYTQLLILFFFLFDFFFFFFAYYYEWYAPIHLFLDKQVLVATFWEILASG